MKTEDTPAYAYLKRYSLFGGVTEEAYEQIRPLLRRGHFAKGQVIVAEGRVNDTIYFITDGAVEILKRAECEGGTELRRMAMMREGETFGEMEFIDIQPCAATVRALEDTATLMLSNRDLYRVSKMDMKTYALLVMNLAREISRRLRAMDSMFAGQPNPRDEHTGD